MHCLVVGGGIFGVTGALELRRRGHQVTLLDPGPLPHPDASSTDLSKVIRMDYGADEFYTRLMEQALDDWRALNESFTEPLYHETGFLILSREPLEPGHFEGDSYALLTRRGHSLDRLDAKAIARRFPLWRDGGFLDGYFNARGGWAESGRVVAALVAQARALGVQVREHAQVVATSESDDRVTGVRLQDGERMAADTVVLATGPWTTVLAPQLSGLLTTIGQPVIHLRPEQPERFASPHLVTWAADIQRTGFYGFPLNRDGLLKVANHGPGTVIDLQSERIPLIDADERFRRFLQQSLPQLADAPIVGRRTCMYSDSRDGDFIIARDPERPGLVVAAGGSGHGFKFAPMLGGFIADTVEGIDNPWCQRFAWRTAPERVYEHSRHH